MRTDGDAVRTQFVRPSVSGHRIQRHLERLSTRGFLGHVVSFVPRLHHRRPAVPGTSGAGPYVVPMTPLWGEFGANHSRRWGIRPPTAGTKPQVTAHSGTPWKSRRRTHDPSVAGSSPARPTTWDCPVRADPIGAGACTRYCFEQLARPINPGRRAGTPRRPSSRIL